MKAIVESIIVSIIAICIIYVGSLLFKSTQPQILEITKEVPREVVKVRTEYATKKIYVERPQRSVEQIVKDIEVATPMIKSNPIVVTINESSIEFPKTVTGSIELDYLKYDFETSFQVITLSKKHPLPLSLYSSVYFNGFSVLFDAGVAYHFGFFYNTTASIGVGIGGASFGIGNNITANSLYRLGLLYRWSDSGVSPFIGLQIKL